MDCSDKRLLLVEDNEMNRMIASISLSEYRFIIEEAFNGKNALEMFESNPEGYYDIVFMDIMMPEMDGIEATKAIRNIERLDAMMIPIVAMTAESDSDEIAKYPEYGFSDYIEKPMEMDKIDAIINKYM